MKEAYLGKKLVLPLTMDNKQLLKKAVKAFLKLEEKCGYTLEEDEKYGEAWDLAIEVLKESVAE